MTFDTGVQVADSVPTASCAAAILKSLGGGEFGSAFVTTVTNPLCKNPFQLIQILSCVAFHIESNDGCPGM